MNSGSCGDKLLFLICESISVQVVGLRKIFFALLPVGYCWLFFFFIDLGFIKLLRFFSIMKGDNFVIGVSSIDSNTINLGKGIWPESLSESDSACRCFSFGVFSLGFWFVSIGIFAEFTDCAPHPLQSPMKRIALGGNPFALANQGYTFSICTLKKGTSNLGSLGFHSQVYYSPREKRENISLSSEWLTLQPQLSASETYKGLFQASERGFDMTSRLIGSGFSNPSSSERAKVKCC